MALLSHGYATGVFASGKIGKPTYRQLPFRFMAGGSHSDHAPLADLWNAYRADIKELFVQVLLLAWRGRYLQLGDIRMDDALGSSGVSKGKAAATSGCWHWKLSCGPKSSSCFAWCTRPITMNSPPA